MKKFILISLLLLLLTACTSKAYTENLELGKKELIEENYQKAVETLTDAKKEKQTDEVDNLLKLAELMNDSVVAFNKGEYEASIYTAKKIKELESNTKFEEAIIDKSIKLIQDSEIAIKNEEKIKNDLLKGKTLLEEKKFDAAYAIFEGLSKNKYIIEAANNESLRDEIITLMNDTINKKKLFIEEQEKKRKEAEEKKKLEEEKKRKEAEEKKKLEEEKKRKEVEEKKKLEEEKKRQEEAKKPLTHEQAIELVKQYINYKSNPNVIVEYDHDNDNGDYVIHVYEIVIDNPLTKDGHTATWGWYGVDPINKYVYDNMNY